MALISSSCHLCISAAVRYEFMVGPPKVILKRNEAGDMTEPYEDAVVEVPEVRLFEANWFCR